MHLIMRVVLLVLLLGLMKMMIHLKVSIFDQLMVVVKFNCEEIVLFNIFHTQSLNTIVLEKQILVSMKHMRILI